MKQKKRRKRRSRHQPSAAVIILVLLALLMVLLILLRLAFHRAADAAPAVSPDYTAAQQPTMQPSYVSAEYFSQSGEIKSYVSPTLTARRGIDVSEYQGAIDWAAVAESGLVDYAIVRAGYRGYGDGQTAKDACLDENLAQATGNGIDVGVYFFSQALTPEEAIQEAQECLSMVEGYSLAYPIYFDWEPISSDSARTATISASELTECALAFCRTIEDAGYEAGIYFNWDLASHYYRLYDLKDYTFWLAEYQQTPTFPYAFDMWQYSSTGSIPGIATRVDLNLSFLPES